MIEANVFVNAARALGFDFWAGVPCSFLTQLINYTISAPELSYVSSANEGDAVAAATGATLGGRRGVAMMQNSGLGNAVSPLTSLNHVFRIPILLIITLRGEPGKPDEPQHELMGEVTMELLETLRIPWGWFPERTEEVEVALHSAVTSMDASGRPYALIMKKGSVAPCPLSDNGDFERPKSDLVHGRGAAVLPERNTVLKDLVNCTDVENTVLVASTGFNGRELYSIEDRPNHLYMVGSMGCASSLGLGLAMARPDKKVVVVDGDGALLMRMGNMATMGAFAGENFYHLLLDNRVHESTGGQQTVSSAVDFSRIASACAYRWVADAAKHGPGISDFLQASAPAFMRIETSRGYPEGLPRPSIKPFEVARRLMRHLDVDAVPWAAAKTTRNACSGADT
jgi:phosphonopyruvate decarboxylase